MSAEKLHDKLVRALEAPAAGYTIVWDGAWDGAVKGFGIRITAAGAKAFVLDYRAGGRQRRITIGSWPDWSTVAGRNEASRLKRLIDQGRDPMAERHHERQAPTVAAVCDRFLAEHVEVHNKPRTRKEYRRIIEKIIKPKLGKMKAAAVEHDDVARLHREMKRTPRQANFTISVLSKLFNLCEAWKDGSDESGKRKIRPLNSNPCKHIRRYSENERDRYLEPEELERVGGVIRDMEAEGAIRPEVAACIRFLAFTGCRLSEAVGMTWDAIDVKKGIWRLPDAKAGARIVPLGAPALALLASLERSDGRVFVDATGKPTTANVVEHAWIGDRAQPKHRKKSRPGIRERAGVPDVRLHDLRHTTGTYAGNSGLNAFMVRSLLGHKTLMMAGKYVSRQVDPLRAAADAISGQIAAAMERPAAEVVEMPKSGRR